MIKYNVITVAPQVIAFLSLLISFSTALSQVKGEVVPVSLNKIPVELFNSADYILIGDTNHADINPRLRLAKFLRITRTMAPSFECLFLEEPSDHNTAIAQYLQSKNPSMDVIFNSQRNFDNKLDALKGYAPDERPLGVRSSLKPAVLNSARLNQFKVYGMDLSLESSELPNFLRAFKDVRSEETETQKKGLRYILEGRTLIFGQNIQEHKSQGQCQRAIVFVGKAHLEPNHIFFGGDTILHSLGSVLENESIKTISIELVD